MSDGDRPDIEAALKAQLAAVQAELDALQQRYNITIVDIGQIIRAPDRVRAHLPEDRLTEESPIFHREFDPPLLQAIKRKIHRLAQEKATHATRLQKKNPNRNPNLEAITAIFEEIYDEALINEEKPPGRRKLAGLAQRLARERGLDGSVSEWAAEKYIKARAPRDR